MKSPCVREIDSLNHNAFLKLFFFLKKTQQQHPTSFKVEEEITLH